MRNIQPIQIWKDGSLKSAEILDCRIVNDDLSSSCTFYWVLREPNSEIMMMSSLADGNYTISGEDYINWDGTNDSSYNIIASQINVTIIT
jgi:hypothetical protein